MSLLDCPGAERDRGLCFSLDLRDPTDIAKSRGTVTGALAYDAARGAYFDGTNDKITFTAPPLWAGPGGAGLVVDFTPTVAPDENHDRFLVSDVLGNDYIWKRNTAAGLVLQIQIRGAYVFTIPYANYSPYWLVNQRNVLVVSLRSGRQYFWLSGTEIYTDTQAMTFTNAYTTLVVGCDTVASTWLGWVSSVKFFNHVAAADVLTQQEASDYYHNKSFNYAQRASCILPMLASHHEPGHATQTTDIDQSAKIADGDMEAATVAAWTTVGAGATFQKVLGARTGGSGTRVLQIIRAGASSYCYQNVLTSGVRYRCTGWARGDGIASWPRVGTDAAMQWSGTTSASWQYFDVTFTSTSIWFVLYNQTNDGTVEFDDVTVQWVVNQLSDGAMESSNTDPWSIGNNAALTKSTSSPYAGLKCLQVAYAGTNNPYAWQTILTIGKRYHAEGWARGDATYVPSVLDGAVVLWTGTTSTTWQSFSVDFTATTTSIRFQSSAVGAGNCCFDALVVSEMRARTLDASGRGNNLILGDGSTLATWPTKLSVRGYSLDGGDYFKRETAIGIPADFTVAMLVRPTSSTGTRALWSCRNSAAGKSIAVYGTAAAETLTILHNVGVSTILTTVPLPLGAASHYVFVYTNTTRFLQIYYNGALAYTSAALTDTNGHDNGFWLGALPTPEYYWIGSILSADVMAFAATPLQVRDHYRQSISQVGVV